MDKKKILKELEEMFYHHTSVLIDPMNGCPGDFAEDYAPIEDYKISKATEAGATNEEIAKAIILGKQKSTSKSRKILNRKDFITKVGRSSSEVVCGSILPWNQPTRQSL